MYRGAVASSLAPAAGDERGRVLCEHARDSGAQADRPRYLWMDELVYKLEEAQSKTFQIQTLRFCFRTSNGKTRAEREQSAGGRRRRTRAAARGESASPARSFQFS
ncbi:hypothetical protein EVAR_91368_1 [Eumeta japonica]|uniref:Uncharacterized protein n=1 Tax=Eumeta variegata TaxID=151549 RepID=A0A4C1XAW5_EUMVA|nr:hypothetical protein EVAR_91368_1 [Eumeta japonica]